MMIVTNPAGIFQVPLSGMDAKTTQVKGTKVTEPAYPVVAVAADASRGQVLWAEDDNSTGVWINKYDVFRLTMSRTRITWSQRSWPVLSTKPGSS